MRDFYRGIIPISKVSNFFFFGLNLQSRKAVIAGDFNFGVINWDGLPGWDATHDSMNCLEMMYSHNLNQIVKGFTKIQDM